MASYRIAADLMALLGAQYINHKLRARRPNETDEQYAAVPVVAGVFIPAEWNDIQVRPDTQKEGFRNSSGLTARLNMRVSPLMLGTREDGTPRPDQRLVEAATQRLLQRGEQPTAYNIPKVNVTIAMRQEQLEKLRTQFLHAVMSQHPEWNGTTYDNNPDLRRAINAHLPYNLGLGYLVEPKNAPAAAPNPADFSDYGTPAAPTSTPSAPQYSTQPQYGATPSAPQYGTQPQYGATPAAPQYGTQPPYGASPFGQPAPAVPAAPANDAPLPF